MSLLENGNNLSAADVAAVVGNNRGNGGYGNGFFGDQGGLFWIIILFLFAFLGNGWGNNGGNRNDGAPIILANAGLGGGNGLNGVQQIIDQQSLVNGINNLNSVINTGFSNAEISRCNSQANILQQMNNNQNALNSAMYGISSSLQNCCCENRANVADLKYTVATENCADRTQAQQNTRDIIDTINNKVQTVMDKMCQMEMDNLKQNYENRITTLQSQYQNALSENQALRFQASQGQQTSQILADNAAQTVALENYLDPPVRPAYIVPNPNGCTPTYYQGGCCGRRIA